MTTNDEATTVAPATTVFDVSEFARTAKGYHRDEIDLSEFEKHGLEPDAARLVRVLRDLERSTMARMRNLLVTATHKDARVTAFLSTWAYEKFWLADALDAVLEASRAEEDLPADEGHHRLTASERRDRRGTIRRAISANFAGPQIVAAHVTAGLADEWITQAAYRRLSSIAGTLSTVVDTALQVKDRHLRFFQEEAERRLAASPKARRLSRTELLGTAWPIGAVERPAEERSFFERIVFGGAEGREEARGIGALISALPGMTGVGNSIEAKLVP
ncbi:hypothetical protein [Schumannella soli]|uniref:Uncharacterized protein n=1 Tax=Schumannella soli TaxID=2590779 RepID=A0A506XWN0_9MICO|nr:hypothetical protein [Schumannella soli]TPW74082.1 hypothetical protein FJ657_15665 [Schumannella soli]